MAAPAPRRGRVLHADGRPAAGALVWVESGTAPTPEIAIVADGDGRFRAALPPGRFVLAARAREGEEGRAPHVVGDADRELVVALGQAPGRPAGGA